MPTMLVFSKIVLLVATVSIFTAVVDAQTDDGMDESAVYQGRDSLGIETELIVDSAMQTMAVEKQSSYMLSDFSEFVDITATSDMDIWDQAIWTTKWMFQKKSFEELVVLYGYPLHKVCRNDLDLVAAELLKVHGAFILPAVQKFENSETPSVQRSDFALAYIGEQNTVDIVNPLNPICSTGIDQHQRDEDWNKLVTWAADSGEMGWTFVNQGDVGAKLAHSFSKITVDDALVHDMVKNTVPTYLVTADPLGIIDPATEIWARCNVNQPEDLGSACKATLKMPRE